MRLLLIGFFSACLAGMGFGGGMLLIPLLTTFAGYGQKEAQYMCLLVYLPAAAAAFPVHKRNRSFSVPALSAMILPGLAGACCGALLASVTETALLRKAYGAAMVLYGAFLAVQALVRRFGKDKIKAKK